MFCRNCGNEVRDGDACCTHCGTPVDAAGNTNQQSGYQQSGYQPVPPRLRKPNDGRGLSIAALVLGICGVALFWIMVVNWVVLASGILGIVFGYMGRKKSIAAYGQPSGLATAGFVLGIVGTAICGLGTISCTACMAGTTSCLSCGTSSLINSYNYLY